MCQAAPREDTQNLGPNPQQQGPGSMGAQKRVEGTTETEQCLTTAATNILSHAPPDSTPAITSNAKLSSTDTNTLLPASNRPTQGTVHVVSASLAMIMTDAACISKVSHLIRAKPLTSNTKTSRLTTHVKRERERARERETDRARGRESKS